MRRSLRSASLAAVFAIFACEDDAPIADGAGCKHDGILRCGDDPTEALLCGVVEEALVWSLVKTCPGQQQCFGVDDSLIGCGTEAAHVLFAALDAPCEAEGAGACAPDRETVLACIDGRWQTTARCAPSRCVPTGTLSAPDAACEGGGLSPGDRCDFAAGAVVCSTDLGAVLACSGGVAVVDEDCAADGRACTEVLCDGVPCRGCR